jgi:hypothetical protein
MTRRDRGKIKPGRSAKKVGGFSPVPTDMQKSPAFHSLTGSAVRVLLWCIFKNYKSATASDTESTRPTFKLTNREAKQELGMHAQTFSRAKKELADKGFIKWVKHGGLKGCNGVASEFCLSGGYKTWVEPPKQKRIPPKGYGKNIKSVTSTRLVSPPNQSIPCDSFETSDVPM